MQICVISERVTRHRGAIQLMPSEICEVFFFFFPFCEKWKWQKVLAVKTLKRRRKRRQRQVQRRVLTHRRLYLEPTSKFWTEDLTLARCGSKSTNAWWWTVRGEHRLPSSEENRMFLSLPEQLHSCVFKFELSFRQVFLLACQSMTWPTFDLRGERGDTRVLLKWKIK